MSNIVFVSRPPAPALRGLVARVSGYATGPAPSHFVETAELVFPLIFNLGRSWRIGIGGWEDERPRGFTAGLVAGPVRTSCPGDAELVQVDLTPLGAARLFGGAAAEMAGRAIELDAVAPFSTASPLLDEQLRAAGGWAERFDLVEQFLRPHFVHTASHPITCAWQLLARGVSVAETAERIGWSARHLSTRFRRETGLRPVTAARMLRFRRALTLAQGGEDWAGIAAEAGYADQPHLIREFREFAGETPTAWAARAAPPRDMPLL